MSTLSAAYVSTSTNPISIEQVGTELSSLKLDKNSTVPKKEKPPIDEDVLKRLKSKEPLPFELCEPLPISERSTSKWDRFVRFLCCGSELNDVDPTRYPRFWTADWIADPRPLNHAIVTPTKLPKVISAMVVEYLRVVDLDEADKDERMNMFAAHKWRTYYGAVPQPNIQNLPLTFEPLWQSIRQRGNYLFYMPPTVNGEQLTVASMGRLAEHPLKGKSSGYDEAAFVALIGPAIAGVKQGSLIVVPTTAKDVGPYEYKYQEAWNANKGGTEASALAMIVAKFTKYVWSGMELCKYDHVRCRDKVKVYDYEGLHLVVNSTYDSDSNRTLVKVNTDSGGESYSSVRQFEFFV